MRDYAKLSPRFWTGETGKKLRGHQEAQIVALYLTSAPGSHMIGMYPLELPTLCHHTGLTPEGARKGLIRLFEVGFAEYDEPAELVWVPEMAHFQIGESLKRGDNNIKGVQRELENYRKSRFFNAFIDRYEKCFHLTIERQDPEAPLRPLGSQEQDQEQEQEQDQEQDQKKPPAAKTPAVAVQSAPEVVCVKKQSKPEPPPEQKSCRRTIAERIVEVQKQLSGAEFAWSAAERAGVVTLANMGDGTDPSEALRLIDVFVARMATDAFYAKNFKPSYIASQVNALRMPLPQHRNGTGARGSLIPASSHADHAAEAAAEKARRESAT